MNAPNNTLKPSLFLLFIDYIWLVSVDLLIHLLHAHNIQIRHSRWIKTWANNFFTKKSV